MQSIRGKLDEIQILIHDLGEPDIVVLTEVWVYSEEARFYAIDGYNLNHTCNDSSSAGGVFIYSRMDFVPLIIECSFQSADVLNLKLGVLKCV